MLSPLPLLLTYALPNHQFASSQTDRTHHNRMRRRDEEFRVERAVDAKRFIEDVGFANTQMDACRGES